MCYWIKRWRETRQPQRRSFLDVSQRFQSSTVRNGVDGGVNSATEQENGESVQETDEVRENVEGWVGSYGRIELKVGGLGGKERRKGRFAKMVDGNHLGEWM